MVGIYCRISGTKEDKRDTSIETQEKKGIEFAKNLGKPYKLYYDIGVSGTMYEKRDDFAKFIKDIQNGIITDIYAINQARLERNPEIWQLFQATVLNAGARWYPNGIYFSLNNTMNRFIASVISLVNKLHADLTSDAVKVAFANNAKKGKGHGIKAYGIKYNDDGYMEQHPEEIEVVKEIFKWSLEGNGAYTIAKKLNEKGVPTRYNKLSLKADGNKTYSKQQNKKWWGSTISGILKNKIYMGVYDFGEETTELPELAILTKEEFETVQDNFKKNKREKRGKRPNNRYLLNGLIYCFDCKRKFFGKRRNESRENTYKCSGKQAPLYLCKGSRGFNISKIETFILHHLFLSKGLQGRLNSIEPDDDEIELQELKVAQLTKNVRNQTKLVTRTRNAMYHPDLADDEAVRTDYITAKNKLKNLTRELESESKRLHDLKDNNLLNKVNQTINKFDLSIGFDAVKASVEDLVERITVHYKKLEKNGIFTFIIKYKGFNESSIWTTDQQLERYTLVGYEQPVETTDFYIPQEMQAYFENHSDKEYFDNLISQLKSKEPSSKIGHTSWGKQLDIIEIKKDDMIRFD
jgi:DNA invertase Pin-like site-specific DNA recombinase